MDPTSFSHTGRTEMSLLTKMYNTSKIGHLSEWYRGFTREPREKASALQAKERKEQQCVITRQTSSTPVECWPCSLVGPIGRIKSVQLLCVILKYIIKFRSEYVNYNTLNNNVLVLVAESLCWWLLTTSIKSIVLIATIKISNSIRF